MNRFTTFYFQAAGSRAWLFDSIRFFSSVVKRYGSFRSIMNWSIIILSGICSSLCSKDAALPSSRSNISNLSILLLLLLSLLLLLLLWLLLLLLLPHAESFLLGLSTSMPILEARKCFLAGTTLPPESKARLCASRSGKLIPRTIVCG